MLTSLMYSHAGHAKAALINAFFAKKYHGRMLLRFDDTNPAKEKEEFEQAIRDDLKRLEITPDCESHTSDHFPLLMELCEQLLREGKAYVDGTPVEQMRLERDQGIESKYRSYTPEQNMALWREMVAGTPEVG